MFFSLFTTARFLGAGAPLRSTVVIVTEIEKSMNGSFMSKVLYLIHTKLPPYNDISPKHGINFGNALTR